MTGVEKDASVEEILGSVDLGDIQMSIYQEHLKDGTEGNKFLVNNIDGLIEATYSRIDKEGNDSIRSLYEKGLVILELIKQKIVKG